jgi:hypothetical protein
MRELKIRITEAGWAFIENCGRDRPKPTEFIRSPQCRKILSQYPNKSRPGDDTIKTWLKDLPFDRTPGRIKGLSKG